MFIYELPGWPDMTWDGGALAYGLGLVRHQQGRLLGRMDALGFDLRDEANVLVLTRDVVESSAIEGELLDATEVRSSIARRLGVPMAGLQTSSNQRVEGIVEVLLDATQQSNVPLTCERLWACGNVSDWS